MINMLKKQITLLALIACVFPLPACAVEFSFSVNGLQDWVPKSFDGQTHYELQQESGVQILFANSISSASGLFNKQKVDLNETPILKWRWKTRQIGVGNQETSKTGDDYPLRLYVVVSGGFKFWKTYSLVYVWSNQAQVGQSWDNPYTANVKHLAVDSGSQHLGIWRDYKRDVKADFKTVFGLKTDTIDAIAVMTDSDNSAQKFESWYGNIKFDKY